MPDWLTHIVVAWTLCTILSFKWKAFNTQNTVIVMVGALIPDLYKLQIPISYFHVYLGNVITPFHLPVGALIIAGIFSLFFKDRKMIFLFLSLGVATHFLLDMLLVNLGGGMQLLYPFSWNGFALDVISPSDYYITIVALLLAFAVYLLKYKNFKIYQ